MTHTTFLPGLATYDDVYGAYGMADDRDDTYDAEFRDPEGYCPHGRYVGGCGADLMCGYCEDGISRTEAIRMERAERLRATRDRADKAAAFLNKLLTKHGVEVGGMLIAHLVQESSHVANPYSRYGRH